MPLVEHSAGPVVVAGALPLKAYQMSLTPDGVSLAVIVTVWLPLCHTVSVSKVLRELGSVASTHAIADELASTLPAMSTDQNRTVEEPSWEMSKPGAVYVVTAPEPTR